MKFDSKSQGTGDTPVNTKPLSLAEVKKAREELVEMGLVQDSGRRRDGHVVWEVSPLGKRYLEALPENKQWRAR